jgi:hypothetical protein
MSKRENPQLAGGADVRIQTAAAVDAKAPPIHDWEDIRAVPCPQCGAGAGAPCLRVKWPHVRRQTAAKRAAGWTLRDERRWHDHIAARMRDGQRQELAEWQREHPDGSHDRNPGMWCRKIPTDGLTSWWCTKKVGLHWFKLHVWQNRSAGRYWWRVVSGCGQFDLAQGWALDAEVARRRAGSAADECAP